MARSTYYAAYKYEWTQLVEALAVSSQTLKVEFEDDDRAENQRQEFYGFVNALKQEASRKSNTQESRWEFEELYRKAAQIMARRKGSALLFNKKSGTQEAASLRAAIADQLPQDESFDPSEIVHGASDVPSSEELEAISGGEGPEDMSSALQEFMGEADDDDHTKEGES